MSKLGCHLFGRVQVIYQEQDIELKSRKALALLAYLAVKQGPTSRDRLATLLWPESDERRARNSLSRVLYQLNQSPLAPALISTEASLSLDTAALEIDVLQFEQLHQRWKSHSHVSQDICDDCLPDLREAVNLYCADFLADFYLSDAHEFEDWAVTQRERLQRHALEMLEALAQTYAAQGDLDQARRYARRQLELDSLRESAVRLLLEMLARGGQKLEALAEFERFKAHLAAELDVEPTTETLTLVTAIRQGDLDPEQSTLPTPPSPAKFLESPSQGRDRRSLNILLEKVKNFWVAGVLEHSLHSAALIDLGKELRPGEVEYPWGLVMQRPGEERYELPPGLSMADIFADNGQALLILGEPGSGKTTMLLDLARSLVRQAESDPHQPIPVVFNLSSWRNGSLLDWLATELNEKYLIPQKIGRQWLEAEALALLLDGLDEVVAEQREDCIQAINAFRQAHGLVPLLVCSRLSEYNEISTKLKLDNAILLQPLNDQQIENYLKAATPQLDGLEEQFDRNNELRELARSPLMLSIMALTYKDRRGVLLDSSNEEANGQSQIFDNYIERMVQRRGVLAAEATRLKRFLTMLASEMQTRGESIFLVEQLQPSWLSSRGQQFAYLFTSRLITFLFLFLGLGVLYRWVAEDAAGLPQVPFRFYYLSWRMALAAIIVTLLMSCFWLIRERWRWRWVQGSSRPARWYRAGVTFLAAAASTIAAILITTIFLPESGIGAWGPTIEIFGTVISRYEWSFVFVFGVAIGIREAERNQSNDIRPVETLRWTWQGAFLGALLGVADFIVTLLFVKEAYVVESSLIAILFATLLFGYQVGVQPQSSKPNGGIALSLRYAIRFGLLFFTLFAVTIAFSHWAYLNLLVGDPSALIPINGLEIGILMGVSAFFYYGGVELIHHFVLRLMLWQRDYAPFNIVPFLERASHLLFLSKVGGGYIFTHALLQSHFADLTPKPAHPGQSTTAVLPLWSRFRAWRGTTIILGTIFILIAAIYVPASEFLKTGDPFVNPEIDPIASIKLTGDPPCDFKTFTPESGRVVVPSLTITNATRQIFVLYWITKEEPIKDRFDAVLGPGDSFSYPINEFWGPAYTGNVFCLRDPQTGKALRSITVVDDSPVILIEP